MKYALAAIFLILAVGLFVFPGWLAEQSEGVEPPQRDPSRLGFSEEHSSFKPKVAEAVEDSQAEGGRSPALEFETSSPSAPAKADGKGEQKAEVVPLLGLQNVYPSDFPVTREELPELARRFGKVDGAALIHQRFDVEGFRVFIELLPPNDKQRASSLLEACKVQMASLSSEAELLLSDAQDDWFIEGRFQVNNRQDGPPQPRPSDGSILATNALFGLGPFLVDVGFRSAYYPSLEYVLGVMDAERQRVRHDLNQILQANNLPKITDH